MRRWGWILYALVGLMAGGTAVMSLVDGVRANDTFLVLIGVIGLAVSVAYLRTAVVTARGGDGC